MYQRIEHILSKQQAPSSTPSTSKRRKRRRRRRRMVMYTNHHILTQTIPSVGSKVKYIRKIAWVVTPMALSSLGKIFWQTWYWNWALRNGYCLQKWVGKALRNSKTLREVIRQTFILGSIIIGMTEYKTHVNKRLTIQLQWSTAITIRSLWWKSIWNLEENTWQGCWIVIQRRDIKGASEEWCAQKPWCLVGGRTEEVNIEHKDSTWRHQPWLQLTVWFRR
jgi:hypothetical protein